MFEKFFGLSCVRPGCGHKNLKGAEFCEGCGISLAFNRPAILDGNQWQPAPDELAAFFKFKDMKKGVFTKTLYVPGGMKAWVLQDDPKQPVLLLDEGAHTTENLFQRMNNFFRSAYGDVLVAKQGAVSVPFAFDKVLSLDRLALKATVTLRLRVRVGEDPKHPDLAAFRRHFMQQPGVVTAEQLARPEWLGTSVLDALKSFAGARSIEEMANDAQLADALDLHLRKRLGAWLLDLGLELVEQLDFSLSHEKLDAQNALQGELVLLRREKQIQQAHTAKMNDFFDAQEREALRVRRMEIERKHQAGKLDEEDADLAQALRLRQLEQYEKICAAQTREQAARLGALDEIEHLEAENAAKRRQRDGQAQTEQELFAHVKAMARIRMESEQEIERLRQASELALARERADQALNALQRRAVLERAAQDEDEAIRSQARAEQVLLDAAQRGMTLELDSRRHEIAKADLLFAAQIRQRETARLQAWEDEVHLAKVSKLREEAARAASDQGIETSRKWMLVARERELQKQEDQLKRELAEHARAEEHSQREFEQKLREEADRRITAAQHAEARRAELAQLGALPVEALIAIAESGTNIQALLDLAKVKTFSGMSPEQILAAQSARPASAAAPSNDSSFIRALSDQLGTLVQTAQQNQSVQHEQATSHQMRMHDGTVAALLRSQELLAQVAMGHPPASPSASAVPPVMAAPQPQFHAAAAPAALRCPQCRIAVESHQHWCIKCGHELPASGQPGIRPAPVVGGLTCPRCRETSPANANFCWCCQHAFGTPTV